MAKAVSPIRLQQDLMDNAIIEGKLFNRSAAEQVEYWAGIGRRLSHLVESDTLLSISAGLATVHIEPVETQPIDPLSVFENIEQQRKNGALTEMIKCGGRPRYQVSERYAGYLERIDSNGQILIGLFDNGVFAPVSVPK